MRPIERIDNFLSKVSWPDLAIKWNVSDIIYEDFFDEKFDNAIKYWKENPDQRIGQVLINLNLIPDNMRIWLDEESDILIDQGIPPEECLYWTSVLDKDESLLEEPITKLIKDLDPNHIIRILEMFDKRLDENLKKAFNNVLKLKSI